MRPSHRVFLPATTLDALHLRAVRLLAEAAVTVAAIADVVLGGWGTWPRRDAE